MKLSHNQIEKYIKNVSSSNDGFVIIYKAKATSERYLPIIHVPQFLNSFCCMAIFSEGQAICSNAEMKVLIQCA